MRRLVRILGGLLLLSLALCAQAQAASFTIEPARKRVTAGDTIRFTIRLDHVSSCTAAPPVPSAPLQLDARGLDSVRLQVAVPRALRHTSYPLRVACDGLRRQEATVRVTGPVRAVNPDARMRLRVTSVHARPTTTGPEFDVARAAWRERGSLSLAYYRDGQCTDWAVQRRPDVIQSVWEASFVAVRQALPLRGLPRDGILGVAATWPAAAYAAGMTVRDTPAVGALVVWQPGSEGANAGTGHIGYVESLSADGTRFATSEMHVADRPYEMGYRTLAAKPVKGRQFIWPGTAT